MAQKTNTLDVDNKFNKTQVKMAGEEIFNVKVTNNIMNYKPKKRMNTVTKAIHKQKRKAIVTLKEGSIDLFNNKTTIKEVSDNGW